MTSLQATIRRYLTPILLLLLAGGFLVVLGELYLYHHWQGTQLIGFAATVIGLVAVLLGLFAKRGFRLGLAILLALISVSGLFGTWEHFESRSEERREAALPALAQTVQPEQLAAAANMTIAYQPAAAERMGTQEGGEGAEAGEAPGRRERGEGGEQAPPPLAPLSLAGLSLMGAAILFAKQDE
ncbi:MAG: hypothetical protein U0X20_23505 [Caldilineaceae bacterium]